MSVPECRLKHAETRLYTQPNNQVQKCIAPVIASSRYNLAVCPTGMLNIATSPNISIAETETKAGGANKLWRMLHRNLFLAS